MTENKRGFSFLSDNKYIALEFLFKYIINMINGFRNMYNVYIIQLIQLIYITISDNLKLIR